MFNNNIKQIRLMKGFGVNELSRLSGVNASYISALERGEKQNPTITTLKKIADALESTVDELVSSEIPNKNLNDSSKNVDLYKTTEFKTPTSAMQFILKQKAIMGYGGFDTNELTDEDIIEFANELLKLLKMLGPKYKK